MDRAKPSDHTDWVDALMGIVVLAGGTLLTIFVSGIVMYW
jgi:hypothetical protein